jgi:hypothetical protein
VRILKGLFAPKWCTIHCFSEVLVAKDLAEKICRATKTGRLAAAWASIYTIRTITDSILVVKEKIKGR